MSKSPLEKKNDQLREIFAKHVRGKEKKITTVYIAFKISK